jgi:hypothetical protein
LRNGDEKERKEKKYPHGRIKMATSEEDRERKRERGNITRKT